MKKKHIWRQYQPKAARNRRKYDSSGIISKKKAAS